VLGRHAVLLGRSSAKQLDRPMKVVQNLTMREATSYRVFAFIMGQSLNGVADRFSEKECHIFPIRASWLHRASIISDTLLSN
jgi:hypothetical protein